MTNTMIADLIHDFDSHLNSGHVWLVELELEFDCPEGQGWINVDTYVIAGDQNLAQYIAHTLYPDSLSLAIGDSPVTPEEYVSRRDRS